MDRSQIDKKLGSIFTGQGKKCGVGRIMRPYFLANPKKSLKSRLQDHSFVVFVHGKLSIEGRKVGACGSRFMVNLAEFYGATQGLDKVGEGAQNGVQGSVVRG